MRGDSIYDVESANTYCTVIGSFRTYLIRVFVVLLPFYLWPHFTDHVWTLYYMIHGVLCVQLLSYLSMYYPGCLTARVRIPFLSTIQTFYRFLLSWWGCYRTFVSLRSFLVYTCRTLRFVLHACSRTRAKYWGELFRWCFFVACLYLQLLHQLYHCL